MSQDRPTDQRPFVEWLAAPDHGSAGHEHLWRRRGERGDDHLVPVSSLQGRVLRACQKACPLGDRGKDRVEIERRTADRSEHLADRRLAAERVGRLVEEADVVDGDDRLGCECLDQLDLRG